MIPSEPLLVTLVKLVDNRPIPPYNDILSAKR